jgi:hypothetical protein
MTQPANSTMTRPMDEMLAAIHARADSMHSHRSHRRLLSGIGALGVVAAVAVALVLTAGPTANDRVTSAAQTAEQVAVYRQALGQSYGQTVIATEPAPQPVGSGWSAADPSLQASLPSQWSPLVNSALKVFEHEAESGQAVTLASVTGQESSEVAMRQGKYAGTSVQVDSLSGSVTDSQGQSWRMTALSQNPFSAGGSVAFQGACTSTVTGTSTNAFGGTNTNSVGTCTNVVVNLVGDPTRPYSATVSKWTGQSFSSTTGTVSGAPGS